VAFSQESNINIRNMAQNIKEYKARIQYLKQEVKHYKGDTTNIIGFRINSFELQEDLGTTLRQMYTSLK
jgi:hypothetical protein